MELSNLDQQVMMAILHLHPNAYGVSVQYLILQRTGREYSFGSIYAVLERLEAKGFIASRQGEPTRERGGKAKLYFTVTASGQRTLKGVLSAMDALRSGLPTKAVPA